jgi:hypothetical protein
MTNSQLTSHFTASAVIETHELSKRFGDRDVIKGIDLRVPRGVADKHRLDDIGRYSFPHIPVRPADPPGHGAGVAAR